MQKYKEATYTTHYINGKTLSVEVAKKIESYLQVRLEAAIVSSKLFYVLLIFCIHIG